MPTFWIGMGIGFILGILVMFYIEVYLYKKYSGL
jgi:hypothetical protein